MQVMFACDMPADERLGSSRTPLRHAAELRKLGVDVSQVFSEDLLRFGGARVDQLTSPFRVASVLAARAASADVVDIAGYDGWLYAGLAHWLRPAQAIVARSNGLWYRAVETHGPRTQASARASLSRLYQTQLISRWERASFVAADMAVFLSRADAELVVSRGWKHPDQVAAVAPCADDTFASPVPLEQRQGVAFVGSFFYRKGSDILAAAMSEVLGARPTLQLTLFGAGLSEDAARSQFAEAVRPRVLVPPMMSPPDLARALAAQAVLVLPTRYEGFGIVVPEAMRAGLAVVVTPTGAGAELVRDGENGLHIPFEDAPATARAVTRLLDDPQLRIRLGRAAAEQEQTRTWSRTAADLLVVYERARDIARRRQRPNRDA
jgi:glycosyltransferase involved in cell wall biosynthesis